MALRLPDEMKELEKFLNTQKKGWYGRSKIGKKGPKIWRIKTVGRKIIFLFINTKVDEIIFFGSRNCGRLTPTLYLWVSRLCREWDPHWQTIFLQTCLTVTDKTNKFIKQTVMVSLLPPNQAVGTKD